MILLASAADLLRVTTSADISLDVAVDSVDLDANGLPTQIPQPKVALTTIVASGSPAVVCASPLNANKRTVKTFSAYNADDTLPNTVIVDRTDGVTTIVVKKVTLDAGDTLHYDEGRGWTVINSIGEVKGVGAKGDAGSAGAPGAVWRSGHGVPDDAVGVDGDFYLDADTGDVYERATGTYTVVASILGPTGADGADGATGPAGADGADGTPGADGADGATWFEGAGAPSGGTGVDNDLYLDTSTGDVYKKVSGSWGSPIANITGPTGATGSMGATGSTGATGPAGPAPSGTGVVRVTSGVLDSPAELSGDVSTSGALVTAIGASKVLTTHIADANVTLAKLANLAQSTIIGRASGAGTGVPTALAASDISTILGLVAIATSGSASDLSAGTIPTARLPTALATIVSNPWQDGWIAVGNGAGTITQIDFTAANILFGKNSTDAHPAPKTCTDFIFSLLDDVDAATARTTLGLAAVAASGSASDLSTGTLLAARMPALTGDVTTSAGAVATSIAANAVVTAKIADANVTLAKMANLAQDTVIGRATGAGTGVPTALTTLPTGTIPALTGDITTPGGSLATTLAKALRNPLGEMITIVNSSQLGNNYGNTNADITVPSTLAPIGIAYVPFVKGASDYMIVEFISSYTGNIELVMMFAMSAANSGNVALRCDVLNVRPVALGAGSGGDPTTNWTPGTAAVITPGNDALAHIVASADFAGFAINSVQRGDFITAIIQRPTASDTHTGDLRMLKIGVRAA